ncbi:MAG: biotin--[acetyl-CoA-carboxylase] ligase [Anaerolineaceae bacterium]|nr:biotin--[acetyl-CoA-carboxylase] ligase [Anaerolineaceae bacterium]
MNSQQLSSLLSPLPLSAVRFYDQVGSTNDLAREWIDQGASELALVVADEQTSGRGRFDRHWVTRPGAALAFSLITYPTPSERQWLGRVAPWGALGVADAIQQVTGLRAEIKWPNDVLLHRRKVCGILVEPIFRGDEVQGIVTGIGINVSPDALPPPHQTIFPATSLAGELGRPIDRWQLLRAILSGMLTWRPKLDTDEFLRAWDERLAFKRERVVLSSGYASQPDRTGRLLGIDARGLLRLQDDQGRDFSVAVGEVHLRPDESHNSSTKPI